jgi:hypothetical protein
MSREQVEIVYDGPAVEQGTMDVFDLAPALFALGRLFERINEIASPGEGKVRVDVRSDNRRGSFIAGIIVDHTLLDTASQILLGRGLATAASLVTLYGGLMKLIKFLQGRKAKLTIREGNVTVSIDNSVDNSVHNTTSTVINIYNDAVARQAIADVVKPLTKPGIERFEARRENEVLETVNRDELQYFNVDLEQDEEEPKVVEDDEVLEIVKPSFEDKYTWFFSNGTAHFDAKIEDQEFLTKVERRELNFGKGDRLEVRIRRTQTSGKKLKTQYSVVKVLRHIPAPWQLPFEVDSDHDEGDG